MIVGLDFRPALLSPTGISRVTKELARHLYCQENITGVRLLGHSLAPAKYRPATLPEKTRLYRFPFPGRFMHWLSKVGIGADTLCGGCDFFLWTDYVFPPVLRAKKAMILHDLAFLVRPEYHGKNTAELANRTKGVVAQCDCILVPSPNVKEDVRRFLPEAHDRTHVLAWGAEHATRFADPDCVPQDLLPPRADAPLFVTVGSVEPRKGHQTLLDAFTHLQNDLPDARLVITGPPGWAAPELLARLEKMHHNPAVGVRWERGLSDDVLLGLLARATALVYPSEYEGFGFPVAEAMALGVPPVIATGTSCAWVAGEEGFTCAPRDVESLVAAMAQAAGNPEKKEERREKCLARAAKFTWEKTAARLAEILSRYL